MNRFIKLSLASVLTIASAVIAFSQNQSKSQPQEPEKIVVERSEVVLDAVVRDKKGRPVTNLTVADFAVYMSDGDTSNPKALSLMVSVLSLTASAGKWLAFSHGPDAVIGELEMSPGHLDPGHVAGNT